VGLIVTLQLIVFTSTTAADEPPEEDVLENPEALTAIEEASSASDEIIDAAPDMAGPALEETTTLLDGETQALEETPGVEEGGGNNSAPGEDSPESSDDEAASELVDGDSPSTVIEEPTDEEPSPDIGELSETCVVEEDAAEGESEDAEEMPSITQALQENLSEATEGLAAGILSNLFTEDEDPAPALGSAIEEMASAASEIANAALENPEEPPAAADGCEGVTDDVEGVQPSGMDEESASETTAVEDFVNNVLEEAGTPAEAKNENNATASNSNETKQGIKQKNEYEGASGDGTVRQGNIGVNSNQTEQKCEAEAQQTNISVAVFGGATQENENSAECSNENETEQEVEQENQVDGGSGAGSETVEQGNIGANENSTEQDAHADAQQDGEAVIVQGSGNQTNENGSSASNSNETEQEIEQENDVEGDGFVGGTVEQGNVEANANETEQKAEAESEQNVLDEASSTSPDSDLDGTPSPNQDQDRVKDPGEVETQKDIEPTGEETQEVEGNISKPNPPEDTNTGIDEITQKPGGVTDIFEETKEDMTAGVQETNDETHDTENDAGKAAQLKDYPQDFSDNSQQIPASDNIEDASNADQTVDDGNKVGEEASKGVTNGPAAGDCYAVEKKTKEDSQEATSSKPAIAVEPVQWDHHADFVDAAFAEYWTFYSHVGVSTGKAGGEVEEEKEVKASAPSTDENQPVPVDETPMGGALPSLSSTSITSTQDYSNSLHGLIATPSELGPISWRSVFSRQAGLSYKAVSLGLTVPPR
jgi:hypothetical protein